MNLSFLIRAIFGLVFFQGVASYIGISLNQYRFLLEFFIVILFFTFIHFLFSRQDKSFMAPGWIWFVIFTIAVITSALINNSDLYTSILMYRQILWPYLFFLSILNIDLSPQSIRKINRFIIILVILQIPAAFYKYVIYGVRESVIIGTFSTEAGSLSTIFPLLVIGYVVAFYFYKKHSMYLLLIPGFMFFAWGGGKRAFFIILPALLLIAYFIYNKTIKKYKINIIKKSLYLVLLISFIGITIYVGGRFHPKFNPEGVYGGSFDPSFMLSQIIDYETGISKRSHGGTTGRTSSTLNILNQIISWDLDRKLFGDGPDRIYLPGDHELNYGIAYGITGFNFNLISIGIAGTLSLVLLYLSLGKIAYHYYIKNSQDPFYKAVALGTILATIVFCFDFFFYSRSFITGYLTSILFFYSLAIILKQD